MSRPRSSHPFAVTTLLVLATLVGAVAIGAIWANRQLLDTGTWVSTSGRMLQSAEVRHRVASFLAEELIDQAETQLGDAGETEVAEKVLPQLRQRAPALARAALRSPQFRVVWLQANRIGHRALIRVLDEEGVTRKGGGRVVIDLTPALRDLANSLGRGQLGSFVEPGAARIEVLEADELERAQDVVRAIRHIPVPATIAACVLFALALLLGRARLRRTVGGVGLSLVAAGVLALLARAIAGRQIVDALLSREADREAAEAAWGIATSMIVDLSAAAIGLGALLVLWAVLLGESGPAVRVRRALAPLLATPLSRLWMGLVVVLLFLVLLVWSPIAALEAPLGVVLFAVVFCGGALILGRQTALEDSRSAGGP
jgi:hypothetical protein